METPKLVAGDNYEVKSRTTDEVYHVSVTENGGKGSCDCKGWQFTYKKKLDQPWVLDGRQPFHCPHLAQAELLFRQEFYRKIGEQLHPQL